MDFSPPLEILLSPIKLESPSLKDPFGVEPQSLAFHLRNRLQTLYAQSFRIRLVPSVLPRLLARS
jgi:hypothetical protein